MKIYISIPISGREINKVRHQADLIKAAISRKGHTPVSPLEIYAGENPTYEDHICQDLRIMLDCDAVYFAPGWGSSIGCSIEHDVVRNINRHRQRTCRQPIRIIYPCSSSRRPSNYEAKPGKTDSVIGELLKNLPKQ